MLKNLGVFFLHKYRFGNTHFFCRRYLEDRELAAAFDKNHCFANRKSFQVLDQGRVFVKTTVLKRLAIKLRVSFMLSRGEKGYDYPLADLINSLNAEASGALTLKLIGLGYQTRFGLVNKVALLYEYLQGYSDGVQWLLNNPDKSTALVREVHQKIIALHQANCYHLDLWLGNVMVANQGALDIQLIDFEHYVSGQAQDAESLLGFIFGHFYSLHIHERLTEAEYDALSLSALAAVCDVASQRFQRAYKLSKQGQVSRRLRRAFFNKPTLREAA